MNFNLDSRGVFTLCHQSSISLVKLIKKLVDLEVKYWNLPVIDDYFPLNITVSDGGEDGYLEIATFNGRWLKNTKNCFQFKSSKMTKEEILDEPFKNKNQLKERVQWALENGGNYYFCYSHDYGSKKLILALEKALCKEINRLLPTVTQDQIKVIDGVSIANWINEHIEAVFYVLSSLGAGLPPGLKLFDQLVELKTNDGIEYVFNKELEEYKQTIYDSVNQSQKVIRIIGQSGIGKTRLIIESLKERQHRRNIIYFEVVNEQSITDFIENQYQNDEFILILDNCSLEFHNRIRRVVKHLKSKVMLISADSELDEYYSPSIRSYDDYIWLMSEDMSSIVPKIIDSKYKDIMDESSLTRLYDYADCNPFMAKLLLEADLQTAEGCMSVSDVEVFEKLLIGRQKGVNINFGDFTTAMRAFSLFKYFGFPNIKIEQYIDESQKELFVKQKEMIALIVCKPPLSEDVLSQIFFTMKKRGVIQQRGRFYEVRPLFLAYSLAAQYIETLTDTNVILDMQDELIRVQLLEAFCDRFRYLDQVPGAKVIADRVCGENSPFAVAEVLNTELGSRLFRSFVEVNPEALIKTLEKLYLNAPVSELKNVDVGRRNLIWSLEILCFNKSTFEKAAAILYRFAQTENENWSNNSRGVFKQLFRPFLSGTEVDFNARLEVLHYSLSLPFEENNDFLIEAIMAAFEIQGASRMSGPEIQGTRVLKDFGPALQDIKAYWGAIFALLKIVWENHPELRGQIEKQFYFKSLQINSIAEPDLVTNFIDWLESKDVSIPTSFYRSLERQLTFPRLPESAKIKIREFLISREPHSSKDKFIRQVRDAVYSPDEAGNRIDTDKTEELVRDLANEFWENGTEITALTDLMLRGQQNYTEIFIQEYLSLNKQNDQRMRLWDLSVEKLKEIEAEGRNWAVLSGVLRSFSEDEKLKLILSLGEIDGFEEIFLSLVNLHLKSVQELETVWNLIIRKDYSPETMSKLRLGFFVFEESFDSIRYICDKLKSFGDIGYWSALDILYRRTILKGIAEDSEWEYCKKTFVEYDYFNLETKPKFIDLFDLVEISQRLVKKFTDTDFINIMTERLLNFLKSSHSVYYDDQFSELAVQLIEINFDEFWRKFSEALLSSDYFVYSAKNLFGSDHGNTGLAKDGILFADEGKWGQIIEWCKENSTKGPISIASLMPIYDHEGTNLHPFAKMMIDEFGNNSDFLVTMSANLGSFGWVGSPIDYYEREKRLYEQLLERPNLYVKDFANKQIEILQKLIEKQKLEEEERFLGL